MSETEQRLEYLRGEIRAERISQGEVAELQGMAGDIDPGDVELLEWAGVPEFPKKWKVRFTDTNIFDVTVQAESEEAAEEIAREALYNGWITSPGMGPFDQMFAENFPNVEVDYVDGDAEHIETTEEG